MTQNPLKQFQKIKRDKVYFVIGIFFIFILIVWTMLSITFSDIVSQTDKEVKTMIKPLSPILDKATLQLIERKHDYAPSALNSFPIYKLTYDKKKRTEMLTPINAIEIKTTIEATSASASSASATTGAKL